jgi:hypothetical protein
MTTGQAAGDTREYRYTPLRYFVSVVISNLMLLLLLGYAINGYVTGVADWKHQLLLLAVPVALASAFLGLHLPTRITVDADGVTFAAYGRAHRYRWAEAGDLQVRPFPFVNDRFLVRFTERRSVFGGRYWIHSHLLGYDELREDLQQRATRAAARRPAPVARPRRTRRRQR